MTYLTDNTQSDLDSILSKLIKNHISFSIRKKDGLITEIITTDKTLLDYARKNNSDLK